MFAGSRWNMFHVEPDCFMPRNNLAVLSRDRVRNFGIPVLKVIQGSTITKTNQYDESNLSVDKLQINISISKKQVSTRTSRYYCLICDKNIGGAILKEMDNLISRIMDHIKYLESQQLRNMKSVSDR